MTGDSTERFDPVFYRGFYADVAASGIDPREHYDRWGRAEGRLPYRLRALAADRDLWMGFTAWALPDLEALAGDGDPRERAVALWSLMRWQSAGGQAARSQSAESQAAGGADGGQGGDHGGGAAAAAGTLARLWADRAARAHLRGPGVGLLAVAVLAAEAGRGGAVARGQALVRARALVRVLARRGETADLDLARGLLARAEAAGSAEGGVPDPAAGLIGALAPAWTRAGLAVPGLHGNATGNPPDGSGGDAIDALAADPAPPGPGRHLARLWANFWARARDRLDGGDRAPPLVSVVVPARDAAATLPTALAGLAAQDWPALEIIVVDDRSSDATAAVARARARADRRIRLIAGPGQGAYAARNAGMAAARGDFLTVHDADDWAHPARIGAQLRPLLADPGLVATLSHMVRIDAAGRPVRWRMEPDEGWVHRNISSLMIRRAAWAGLGAWDRVRAGADSEFLDRLVAVHGAAAVADVHPGVPLSVVRAGAGSLTAAGPTHVRTRLFGPRRDYEAAAARWRARRLATLDPALRADRGPAATAVRAAALHLPAQPARRPFAMPAVLEVGDAPAAPAPDDVIRASALFDARWYLEHNPDVRADGICPAIHYARSGAAQGRDPGPGFSTTGYRLATGLDFVNPLVHRETVGARGGTADLPEFPGALAGRAGPRVLVCAHQAGAELYGAERSFLDMLDRIAEAGAVPVAVLPHVHNPAYLDAVRARAGTVHVVPMPWWHIHRPPHPVTLAALGRLIAHHGAAAVHVNTCVLQAPRLAGRAAGAEVVVHLREMPASDAAIRAAILGSAAATAPPGPEAAATIRMALLAEADRIVANSPAAAAWVDCPDRVAVVGNRVDPALFDLPVAPRPVAPDRVAPASFTPDRPLCAALISSNIAKKGIADAVAVARLLEGAGAPVRIRLIGPDTPDLAALGPLPASVECPGYADGPAAALAGADVVLSLSHVAESFGRSVLEALAAGRPAVVYDRGHPPVLVGRGAKAGGAKADGAEAGGVVVAADDVGAVAAALAGLAADPARLARLSGAARARARAVLAGDGMAGDGKAGAQPAGG